MNYYSFWIYTYHSSGNIVNQREYEVIAASYEEAKTIAKGMCRIYRNNYDLVNYLGYNGKCC